MDAEQKRAMAEGRAQAKAVRSYLDLVADGQHNKDTPPVEDLEAERAELHRKIDEAQDSLHRLELIQRRLDVEAQLAQAPDVDVVAAERGFIEHAAAYAERKGLSWPAFRDAGVPASVLREAGLPQRRWPRPD